MILNKSKHHFWSQLLVSVVAIFALPGIQPTKQTEYPNQYQTVQQQVRIYQIQQQSLLLEQYFQPISIAIKLAEISPQFINKVGFSNAPIRGSPII